MCIKEIKLKRQENCKLMTSIKPYQIYTTWNKKKLQERTSILITIISKEKKNERKTCIQLISTNIPSILCFAIRGSWCKFQVPIGILGISFLNCKFHKGLSIFHIKKNLRFNQEQTKTIQIGTKSIRRKVNNFSK